MTSVRHYRSRSSMREMTQSARPSGKNEPQEQRISSPLALEIKRLRYSMQEKERSQRSPRRHPGLLGTKTRMSRARPAADLQSACATASRLEGG